MKPFFPFLIIPILLWGYIPSAWAQRYERPDKPPPTTVTPWLGTSFTYFGYAVGGGVVLEREDISPWVLGFRVIPPASIAQNWPSPDNIMPLDWTHYFGLWVRKNWDWPRKYPEIKVGITGMYSYGSVGSGAVNLYELLPHLSYGFEYGPIRSEVSAHLGALFGIGTLDTLPQPTRVFLFHPNFGFQLLFFLDLKKKETIEE